MMFPAFLTRTTPIFSRISTCFGNLSLRRKYLFSHVAVVILTICVLSPASYLIARSQLEKRAGEYSTIILDKAAYIWNAKVKEIVDYFLMQFGAYSIGQKLKEDVSRDPGLKRVRIERALSDIITYRAGIRFILIDSIDSNIYFSQQDGASYRETGILGLIPEDHVLELRAKPFFQTAPDGTIFMSKVIYDLQSTEFLGILTVGFDHDAFSIVFPEETNSPLGNMLILDEQTGHPVIASRGGEKIFQMASGSAPEDPELEKKYLIEEIRSVDERWILRSYTSIHEISNLSLSAGLYIVLVTSFAIAAAVGLSLSLSRRESQRIGRIKDYARQIAAGELGGFSPDNHRDELGLLSGTLEDLAHRIADLVEGLASEKARLDEVRYSALQFEYSALQAKINPHFLYNTLEMINAMAKLNGEYNISEIVQLMAELMRDSIRRSNSLIPLKEEIEYIGKYLKIQDLLNENKLKVSLDIPGELNNFQVPNFILQPIVENAITHGIEPLNTPGEISISACREADRLILSVRDNGVGMTDEQILSIMNREEEEETSHIHTKLGLVSVDRRIKIVYDQSCGLEILSSPGTGTTVRMILRLQDWRLS